VGIERTGDADEGHERGQGDGNKDRQIHDLRELPKDHDEKGIGDEKEDEKRMNRA